METAMASREHPLDYVIICYLWGRLSADNSHQTRHTHVSQAGLGVTYSQKISKSQNNIPCLQKSTRHTRPP
jgi:hypothetical protein